MTDPDLSSMSGGAEAKRRVPRWGLFVGGFLLLGALGLLGALTRSGTGKAAAVCDGRATGADQSMPALEGHNIADSTTLRYEPGTVTVINVWGSWCGPCRLEQPMLVRAAKSRPDVRFLGLDVQDNDASGRAFQREFDVPYPSISDQSRELASRLGAVATPATFVVDRQGTVRAKAQGAIDYDTLACMVSLAAA